MRVPKNACILHTKLLQYGQRARWIKIKWTDGYVDSDADGRNNVGGKNKQQRDTQNNQGGLYLYMSHKGEMGLHWTYNEDK